MKLLHRFAGAFGLLVYTLIASMPVGYVVAQAPGFINQYNAVCDPSFPTRCAKPDVSGNLPVTGSFALTNPTIGSPVPGTGNYIAGNKAGNLTGLTLDGSSNLNVNCTAGCAGGTFNNNADAVATSATNGQVAAWMYGYNGATFDRLRVDASKNLLTALNAAIPAGGNTIGAVTQASGPWTVNQTQINGVALLAGNGVTGTGSPRVTIASDNTAFTVNAAQSGTWTTRVVGNAGAIFDGATGSAVPANALYMGISDGGTLRGLLQAANALNSTGTGIPTAQIVGQFDDVAPTSITENQFGNVRMSANRNVYTTLRDAAGNERGANVTAGNALAIDVTSIAGTAALTGNGTTGAGSQRVTIASDNTAFSVNAVQSGNWTARVVGNAGVAFDAAVAAGTAPTNGVAILGIFNSTEPSPTTGQSVALQLDSKGRARNVIMDGAGNTRAANVDANNNLGVVLPAETTKVIGTVRVQGNVGAAFDAARNAAIPANALMMGISDATNIQAMVQASNGLNSTGTGIPAVQQVGQCDDVSITALTENQFGNVREDCTNHALITTPVPSATAGGTTLFTLTAANSTNATNIKASAGQVYSISGYTISATAAWVSFYNNAGTPTCGTSIIQQFLIPGNASGAGFNYPFPIPKGFATGIAICITTGIAGTGSVAASSYVVNIDYK